MSPERAARGFATLGAVLLLALFALRVYSIVQTFNTPALGEQEPAQDQFVLGGYTFSPDGTEVSFVQGAPGQVPQRVTMDLTSGVVRDGRLESHDQVTTFRVDDGQLSLLVGDEYVPVGGPPRGVVVDEVSYSPRGDAAAFIGQRPGGPDGLYILYTTGRVDWLGEEEWMRDIDWSPDGQILIYIAPRNGFNQIITIRPDGSGQFQVTADPTHKSSATWSPDGTSIAYLAEEVVPSPPTVDRELVGPTPTPTPTPDLSGTPSPTPTAEPSQAPPIEGTYLGSDIFLIDTNGANVRRLTSSPDREHTLAWINGASELAFATNDPENENSSYLFAVNPQTGSTRRVVPQVALDAIECPQSLPRLGERMLRLTLSNQGIQPTGVPVVLRAGQQPFSIESIYEVDQRRTGAVQMETVDLQPGETRTIEWPISPVPGLVTHFSAVIDRSEALLFSEQHCAVQNTYLGLPNLPFLPFALPMLAVGMLLQVPWLLQQKRTLLWILWALIPIILLGMVLYEAQQVAIDKFFMLF